MQIKTNTRKRNGNGFCLTKIMGVKDDYKKAPLKGRNSLSDNEIYYREREKLRGKREHDVKRAVG